MDALAEARAAAIEARELLAMCAEVAPPGVDLAPIEDQANRISRQILRAERLQEEQDQRIADAEPGVLLLDDAWADNGPDGTEGLVADLHRLLVHHAAPTDQPLRTSPELAFQGIRLLEPREAVVLALGAPPLQGHEPVTFSPWPADSLTLWRYESPRPDAYNELRVFTDAKDQVAALQLVQNQESSPRFPDDLFREGWTLVDLLTGRALEGEGEQAAHRVRAGGSMLRIDSEWLQPGPEGSGLISVYRASTILPEGLAGLVLHRIHTEPQGP
jgi:hypothetical protein